MKIWIPKIEKGKNRLRHASAWGLAALLVFAGVSYLIPEIASSRRVFRTADAVPKSPVAVVLGTSEFLADGRKNAFFTARMAAAAELYGKGKADCILVSGDNSAEEYNETRAMQLALMDLGIPPERIFLDYAGFRTLDSVVRAVSVFGQKRFVIVTQAFQADRALLIARSVGADAVAYAASDPGFLSAPMTYLREIPARALAFYDVLLAKTGAKYLGVPVRIETDPSVRPVPEKVCYPR